MTTANKTILYYNTISSALNSLAPGKFERNFRHIIFKQTSVIDGEGMCSEIALIWMSLDFTDDQSTMVQVMAWCRQASSHYLSQCWPRSLSSYGVTRPQWVNLYRAGNTWVHTQHCGYWCPQCWVNLYFIGPVSCRNISVIVNNIGK